MPRNIENNRTQILRQAFEQMPDVFTSHEFSKKAKSMGFTSQEISQGQLAQFLHKVCHKKDGRLIWTKTTALGKTEPRQAKIACEDCPIERCIKKVKESGFKVMKVKYEEI